MPALASSVLSRVKTWYSWSFPSEYGTNDSAYGLTAGSETIGSELVWSRFKLGTMMISESEIEIETKRGLIWSKAGRMIKKLEKQAANTPSVQ